MVLSRLSALFICGGRTGPPRCRIFRGKWALRVAPGARFLGVTHINVPSQPWIRTFRSFRVGGRPVAKRTVLGLADRRTCQVRVLPDMPSGTCPICGTAPTCAGHTSQSVQLARRTNRATPANSPSYPNTRAAPHQPRPCGSPTCQPHRTSRIRTTVLDTQTGPHQPDPRNYPNTPATPHQPRPCGSPTCQPHRTSRIRTTVLDTQTGPHQPDPRNYPNTPVGPLSPNTPAETEHVRIWDLTTRSATGRISAASRTCQVRAAVTACQPGNTNRIHATRPTR